MSLSVQLGRLWQVRLLGTGGFATVWLYHDEELDSPVAVKALADNWAHDEGIRERFLAESRLLRRASSPHVVQVHDVGVTDTGTPYFVMTYADQGSLADLLATGARLQLAQVVDVVSQAARGLADLHAQGVVHRDIKPQNLLLATRPDGTRAVLVADLGVAKTLAADSGATMHVGTPAYGAPEQSDPMSPLDPRADVYGLGAVAYALVAGRAPLPPVPLTTLVPGLSPDVDRVIATALQPDREHRWPDVTSFARALDAAVRGVTSPVPAPAAPPAASSGSSRRWLVALAAVIALGVLGTLAVVLLRGGVSGDDAFEQAGVEYVEALRSPDCETELSHVPREDFGMPMKALCSDANLHWQIAKCIDPEKGEIRVDPIGDNRARVVFVGQGYVEIVRGSDTLFRARYMVGCLK